MKALQILLLVFALGCNRAAAQGDSISVKITKEVSKCKVLDDSEWAKVDVRKMETKKQPKNFRLAGESIIKIHGSIKTLEDLNDEELTEIKKRVAKSRCCVAYVDVSGKWGAKAGELYFYYGFDK